jgi:NADP-dependent 3-hydroxy acid dehydrogenase YdfG
METAIVAGVGPGLGAALARAFAREGFAVGLLARKPDTGSEVAWEIRAAGGKAASLEVDVTQRDAVRAAVERLGGELGAVTALAYNASGFGRGKFLELDPDSVRAAFEVSVMGALHLAQAVIPGMLQAGRGFISLTGATASLRGRAGFAGFAIAKSGLRMLGQSLAREFHPQGIHVVHVVVDGQIDNPRSRARDPKRDTATMIPPRAIADAVIAALKQPKNAWTHEFDIRPAAESF